MRFLNCKILLVFGILLAILLNQYSFASSVRECSACPAHKPCKITIPADDKCNTCQYNVHCSDDQWYKDILVQCTKIDCSKMVPIDNPFEIPEEDDQV